MLAICHALSQLDDVGDKFSAFHSLSLPLKWCPSIYLKCAHIQIIYKRAPGGSVVQVIDNINRAVLLLARLHRELQKRVEDQGKDEEEAGWQKLRKGTKGLRRKVWTQDENFKL